MGSEYGIPAVVPRIVERATATLPQTTQHALFTVAGRILLHQIIGEVTVEIGAGANNATLIANPTVGADVDICAQADIDGDVVGTLYNITGTLADALVPTTSGAVIAQVAPVLIADGTIDLDCPASKAGSVKWTIHYSPVDEGSIVTAA
jgi:hypothetical protein